MRVDLLENLYNLRSTSTRNLILFFKMKKQPTHGGAREGAGRKPQGKKSYLLSLTEKNVAAAKKREKNFSGLMDGLLHEWLKT
jgi:hypothetical protein